MLTVSEESRSALFDQKVLYIPVGMACLRIEGARLCGMSLPRLLEALWPESTASVVARLLTHGEC